MLIDYLFLGNFFPKEDESNIRNWSKGGIQNAANLLQWDYIQGIESNLLKPISLITRMSIGTYPFHYKKAFIHGHSFSHVAQSNDVVIGCFNAFPVRPLLYDSLGYEQVEKWIKASSADRKVIIAYSYGMSKLVSRIKSNHPEVVVAMILLDLPRYTDMARSQSFIYQYKHKVEESKLKKAVACSDIIVPITEQMANEVDPGKEKRCVVIDGMFSDSLDASAKTKKNEQFVIAYTGTLTKAYGILNLVQAVVDLNDDSVQLVICGSGEAKDELQIVSKENHNIVFLGEVSSAEAKTIQRNADLLVNPRENSSEYTKFSFPSKILQYMSSGTPVLCYQLSGMGREYDPYLLYVRDGEKLSEAIKRIRRMGRNELELIGAQSYEFVKTHKNNVYQTKKILECIDEVINHES